ncbi:hypothetical protein F2Q69_00018247 [Brassica cretica]|uniref:Uncharacterized protein n=1 Tax=Brassica cretica TaxID=69181 RepID=A0A8S9Q466_BRACR|nr:hypothetical protein F2Q69_00018247 [Brassica cretica]
MRSRIGRLDDLRRRRYGGENFWLGREPAKRMVVSSSPLASSVWIEMWDRATRVAVVG